MNINGIIAEYNPLHNGHKYQIMQAKKANHADYTVVVMSGNFVQRGEAAIFDKYMRTNMALLAGADLVLELPALYATASAEFFALGSVSLLDKLGAITHLSFGSECGDISQIQRIAVLLSQEKEPVKASLKELLREGYSYPKAKAMANAKHSQLSPDEEALLTLPNNILGIEYCKALLARKSAIQPTTLRRVGADYNDKELNAHMSSALSIRNALSTQSDLSAVKTQIPEEILFLLEEYANQGKLIFTNDFSQALYYKLVTEGDVGFEKYLDVSKELSDRIKNAIPEFKDFDSFCQLLKTKDVTYTRISRCLIHILLNITKAQMEESIRRDFVPYARILGFRKAAAPLLNTLKEHATIPLISKLADAHGYLDTYAREMLEQDLLAGKIYRGAADGYPNEFSTPIVIL